MKTYYLVNSLNKQVTYVGPLPEVWSNITGLCDMDEESLRDLSWAGEHMQNLMFLNEDDARKFGVSPALISIYRDQRESQEWEKIREQRDARIQAVRWRVERHSDRTSLGLPGDPYIRNVLIYIQSLRDITTQSDPFNIVWPNEPPQE
jgi:hypothetical protein